MAYENIDDALPHWDPVGLDADLRQIIGRKADFSPGRERDYHIYASRTSKGMERQRVGLDPLSRPPGEVPSLREATSARELAERNLDVSKWLAGTDNDLTAPTEKPEHGSTAIDTSEQVENDGVTPGDGTENQAKPGQTLFIEEHGGPMVEEDYRIILASRTWGDAPILPSISRPGASRHQPQSSQAAIEKFTRLCHDGDSVVSKAATWGTRRRSVSSVTDLNLETSGNVLKKLSLGTDSSGKSSRPKRVSILQELRDIVTKPSRNPLIKNIRSYPGRTRVGHGDRTTSWSEDKASTAGTHVPMQSASRRKSLTAPSGARNSLSITSSPGWSHRKAEVPRSYSSVVTMGGQPNPGNMPAKSGSPPVRNPARVATGSSCEEEDHEGDDYMEGDTGFNSEVHFIDGITSNSVGFQQHLLQLNPSLAHTNQFLVDRISHQQVARYKSLLSSKLRHSLLRADCPSGSVCVAMGGSAKRLEPRDIKEQSDTASSFSGASDDEYSARMHGRVTQETFPPDIPLPPTYYLPAEVECQLCFQRKKIYKASDWTKHVHEDVQPFTCTWENCKEPVMFKRKADWVRHENEHHRQLQWWRCDVEDCAHICFRRDIFVQHLVREHKFPEPGVMTSDDMMRFGKGPGHDRTTEKVSSCHKQSKKCPEDEPCRFCGKRFWGWKKLTTHLAKHMEQITLPVLRLVDAKGTNRTLSPAQDVPLVPPTVQGMNLLSSGPTMISKGPKRDSWDSNAMSETSIASSDDAVRSLENSISQTASTLSSRSPFRITDILMSPHTEITSAIPSPTLARLTEEGIQDDEHMKGSQDSEPEFDDNALRGTDMDMIVMEHPDAVPSTLTSYMEHIQRCYPHMSHNNLPLACRLAYLMKERLNTLQMTRRLHRYKAHHSECLSGDLCSANNGCFRWRARKMLSDSSSSIREDLTTPEEMSIWVYGLDMPSSLKTCLPVELECPVCFNLQTFHTPDDWRAHIMADLAPYTCTFAHCRGPSTFSTVSSWLEHEESLCDSLYRWRCNVESCQESYHQRDLFIQHLVQQHDFPDPARDTSASIKTASSTIAKVEDCQIKAEHPTDSSQVCCFCGIELESRGDRDLHHARHVEWVGLLILHLLRGMKDDGASTILETHSIPPTTSLSGGVRDLVTPPLDVAPTIPPQKSHHIQGNISSSPMENQTSNIAMDYQLERPGTQSLPHSVSEKGANSGKKSSPDTAEPPVVSQEGGEEDNDGCDALEPSLEPPADMSAPVTPTCTKNQPVGAPEGIDAEMADAGPEESTPSTDTSSTTEDARSQTRWQPTRQLRQIGVAQVRIEKVYLSHSLYASDSSEDSECYDEDLEEVDDNGNYNKNTDQSGSDRQGPGSSDHSIESQNDQSIRGSQSNKRKRQASQDEEGQGGADDNEDGQQPDSTAVSSNSNSKKPTKKWACPFQVYDVRLKCFHRSRKNPHGGCDSISRLKQHLSRKHRRSFRCERCCRSFDTKQQMASHGAQEFPCEFKMMPTDECFMSSEAEKEMDKPCRMASPEDTWYYLFRHVIFGMLECDISVIKQQFSPYYTYRDTTVTIPSISFPASALQLDQGADQQSSDRFGAPHDQQFQSLSVPMYQEEGSNLFNNDPSMSFNPIPSDTAPSEASLLGVSLMSNGPSSSAFSVPSTGMSLTDPSPCDAHLRQSYDRIKADNQRLQDDNLKNVTDVVQIQRKLEELLYAGCLNDQAQWAVTEISSLLGGLKKRLV